MANDHPPRKLRQDIDDEAAQIFERFLVREEEPDDDSFDDLCFDHPAHGDALRELWAAHDRCQRAYLSIQPDLPSEPPLPRKTFRSGLHRLGIVAAALLVGLVSLWALLGGWSSIGADDPADEAASRSEVASIEPADPDQGAAWSDEDAYLHILECVNRTISTAFGIAPFPNDSEVLAPPAEQLRDCASLHSGTESLLAMLGERRLEPRLAKRLRTIAENREVLRVATRERAERVDPALAAELASASTSPLGWKPETPEVRWLFRNAFGNVAPAHHLSELSDFHAVVRKGNGTAGLEVSVFDLDRGGERVIAPIVYAQRVEFEDGAMGQAILLPLLQQHHALESGDWRLTAVDPVTRRHAVVRVFLPPETHRRRILFLRAVDPDFPTAWFDGGEFEYGSDQSRLHVLPRTVFVPGFWMASCEVTRADFGRFWMEWESRPEWAEAWSNEVGGPTIGPPRRWPWSDDDQDVLPATGVAWESASLYSMWSGMRLPTDREWEFVATHGGEWNHPWGPDWVEDATVGELGAVDRPQGATPPGTDGQSVYRLSDNVSEFVEGLLVAASDEGVLTLVNYTDRLHRIGRGGSFLSHGPNRNAYHRGGFVTGASILGWRCARSPYPSFAE